MGSDEEQHGTTGADKTPIMPLLPDIGAGRFTQPVPTKPQRRWFFTRLATAAVAILVLVGGWFLIGSLSNNPKPLSASDIIQRAQAVFTDGTIKSMVITETIISEVPAMGLAGFGGNVATPTPGPKTITSTGQTSVWYEAPNRWRTENGVLSYPSNGGQMIEVSDGNSIWSYYNSGVIGVNDKNVSIQSFDIEDQPKGSLQPLKHIAEQQYSMLQGISQCYTPTLQGSDVVAGRLAYVIDTGESHCSSSSPANMQTRVAMPITLTRTLSGRYTFWIDQSSYFLLKFEAQGQSSIGLNITTILNSAQFNAAIDPSVFTFTPPSDAIINDYRPKEPTSQGQVDAQLQDAATRAGYPLFAPSYLPANLTPRQPRATIPSSSLSGMGIFLVLEYVPPNEANQATDARDHGLRIDETKLDNTSLYWPITNTVYISGWRGQIEIDHYGSDLKPVLSLLLYRDGNQILLSSATMSKAELIKVANSLTRVPLGNTPTPTPVPHNNLPSDTPSLDDWRGQLGFAIFAPTKVPSGLIVEPPVASGGYTPTTTILEIVYHNPDGSFALSILSGAKGCCRDTDTTQQGEAVTLTDGSAAHFLNNPPEQGGPTLWLIKQNSYVELRGLQMGKDQLIAIANTLSSTANPYAPEVSATPTP